MVCTDSRNLVSSEPSLAKSERNLNSSERFLMWGRATPDSKSPSTVRTNLENTNRKIYLGFVGKIVYKIVECNIDNNLNFQITKVNFLYKLWTLDLATLVREQHVMYHIEVKELEHRKIIWVQLGLELLQVLTLIRNPWLLQPPPPAKGSVGEIVDRAGDASRRRLNLCRISVQGESCQF